jgi:hypothetical protein
MNNFGQLLASIFYSPGGAYPTVTVTNHLNAAKTLVGWGSESPSDYPWSMLSVVALNRGVYFAVGSSSNVPARTDYGMGGDDSTILGSWTYGNTTTPSYDNVNFQVDCSGAVVLASGGVVAECGVGLKLMDYNDADTDVILIAHDLVAPTITVPAGGSVACNWTLQI